VQSAIEVIDRLAECEPAQGQLTGCVPVRDGSIRRIRAGEVMRNEFRFRASDGGEVFLQRAYFGERDR
jgi:hypothetical protein